MAPASTIGRHDLATRFTANVRILFIEYPSREELSTTYTEFCKALFSASGSKNQNSLQIAKSMSQLILDLY